MAAVPLEGPNAGWVCDALDEAFRAFGPPRHLISDHEGVFIGAAFKELLDSWRVKHRFGAVGKHGSIAVTERVIKTLKYEWLFRVPLIRGFDHLEQLCVSREDKASKDDIKSYTGHFWGPTTIQRWTDSCAWIQQSTTSRRGPRPGSRIFVVCLDCDPVPVMERRHHRLLMGGLAADLVLGGWLLKAEAAWLYGLKYANLPGEAFWRLDAMIIRPSAL